MSDELITELKKILSGKKMLKNVWQNFVIVWQNCGNVWQKNVIAWQNCANVWQNVVNCQIF